MATVHVHVDFGGRYFLVTQHCLDGAQIGTSLQQVGGKAVAEGVRADVLLYACSLSIVLDEDKEADATQMLTTFRRDEDVVLLARLCLDFLTHDEPFPQPLDGLFTDGHQAVLASLSVHTDVTFFKEQFADLQFAELADAQAATVEHLDDGPVANALGLAAVDDAHDGFYLSQREHFGQVLADLRTLQQLRGVGLQFALQHQEAVERPDTAQDASNAAGLHTQVGQRGGKVIQLLQRHLAEVDALVCIVVEQLLEILQVGIQRVVRIGTLKSQVLHVFAQNLVTD